MGLLPLLPCEACGQMGCSFGNILGGHPHCVPQLIAIDMEFPPAADHSFVVDQRNALEVDGHHTARQLGMTRQHLDTVRALRVQHLYGSIVSERDEPSLDMRTDFLAIHITPRFLQIMQYPGSTLGYLEPFPIRK